MATQMIIRIDRELKDKLAKVARQEGKTASQAVRELVEDYIKERDIGGYIDDLWDRVGGKLKRRGFSQRDIASVIKKTRAKAK